MKAVLTPRIPLFPNFPTRGFLPFAYSSAFVLAAVHFEHNQPTAHFCAALAAVAEIAR